MRQREAVKNGTCCAAGFPLPKGSFLQLCTGQKSFTKSPGLSEQKWQTLCPPTLQLLFIDGIPFTSAPPPPKPRKTNLCLVSLRVFLLFRPPFTEIPLAFDSRNTAYYANKKGGAHPCLMMMTERIGEKSRSITYGK